MSLKNDIFFVKKFFVSIIKLGYLFMRELKNMIRIKKNIVYVALFCFFVQCFFSPYVFAEDVDNSKCSACNATPVAMQAYINFEVDMLEALQEVSETKSTLLANPNNGLFTSWMPLLKSFIKSTTAKVKKDLDSEVKAARAARITTVLLSQMLLEDLDSATSSVTILFKDRAFVRDYKILQEIDMSVNDVIWDMGMLGIWDDKASSQVQVKILWLQYKYSQIYGWEYPIFTKLSISWSVKNKQLLYFILRVNWLMKNILSSVRNSVVIDSSLERFESWYSKWNIIAEVNRDYIEMIQSEYSCATMKICNETVGEALAWVADVSNLTKSFWRSWDTIKDSITHLKELKNPWKTYTNTVRDADNTWWLTERQVELLRTVYGLDSRNLTTSQIETLKKNWSNIKWNLLQPFSDLVKSSKNWHTVLNQSKDANLKEQNQWKIQETQWKDRLSYAEKQQLNNQFYWQSIMPISTNEQSILNELQNSINDILVEKSYDKEILLVWLNLNTHYFVEIWSYIHYIVETAIGDKNSDWLVDNLWKACTYQCGNNWKENCYADN